jgi:Glycosyl transferase family 2
MLQPPRVSIGLPVYNGQHLLPRALDSILRQVFADFEVIISDNCSTDDTTAVCEDYAKRDRRIRYVRQPGNLGAAANFNFVFRQARGEYFKWAAHDDQLGADFLDTCVGVLDADPGVVLSCTETELINDDGSPLIYDARLGAYVDRHGKPWHRGSIARETSAEDPVKRFVSVVVRDSWCLEVFGLIRTAALRQTSLIGRYYGSDKILLAQLATMGRFHTAPRRLFFRGCQPTQSSYLTPQEQARWIRGHSEGIRFDQAAMFVGLLKAAGRPTLTYRQRQRCALAVLRLAINAGKLKRVLVPGTQNYFGIGAGGRGA